METNTINIDKKKLVTDIKQKSELQRFYKNQRKSKHIIGERKMPEWEASYRHADNRHNLRIMYAVYGLSKGKSFSEIEKKYSEENHPLNNHKWQIDKYLKKYKIEEETVV